MNDDTEHRFDEVDRPLSETELQLIQALLSAEFPGVEQLRAQLPSTTVSAECSLCPQIVLTVSSSDRAEVEQRVPVMAEETGDWYPGRLHVLLHVVDGALSEVEFYRDDGSRVEAIPSLDKLAVTLLPPVG